MIMINVDEFQKKYPSKKEKIEALKKMSNEEINNLIKTSTNVYGKIFYKSFLK